MNREEPSRENLQQEIKQLRDRVKVAEEILRAIRAGETGAIVVSSSQGDRGTEFKLTFSVNR